MTTRTLKAFGVAASAVAVAVSVPFAISAEADPAPSAEFPDPEGPGCDAFKAATPGYKSLHEAQTSQALASIKDISTFYSAVSGQLNPAVNTLPMLDNGPYVIFAPSNDAFAALDPSKLDALKADPTALGKLVNYHVFLGLLGPEDVHGQRPSQEGGEIKVTGKGGDVKVNDTAKVVCGGIVSGHARIYIIDTVLDPTGAPEAVTPTSSSGSSSSTSSSTSSSSSSSASSPSPAPSPGT